MMLLNIFNYLSDGRAPLVEDLRPPEVSKLGENCAYICIRENFIFFLDLPEAKKASCEPLTARQSLVGSKASSLVKIEYLRTLSFQAFLLYFRFR